MAIGMEIGTKFYLLAIIAAVVISLMVLVMTRFNWFAREMSSQILRIHVPNGLPFDSLFDQTLLKFTSSSQLLSVDSANNGMLSELTYTIGLKRSDLIEEFISELKGLKGNNKVTLIAGHNNTDP